MKKLALVLGGGGARGAYEVGVWEALIEENFSPDIVTGTSVGALNAAFIAQDSFDTAKEIWLSIDNAKVLGSQFEGRLKRGNGINNITAFAKEFIENGGADASALHSLLTRYVDEDKIRENKHILFGLVTAEFPAMRPQKLFIDDIPRGKLVDFLMASSACFPAMRAYEMDGKAFVDGGFSDNLPAKMATEKGAKEIIAVNLDAPGIVHNLKHLPGVKEKKIKITEIKSRENLGEILNFDKDTAARNMRLGYLDTKRALGKLDGFYYAIKKDSRDLVRLNKMFDTALSAAGIGNGGNRLLRRVLLRGITSITRGEKVTEKAAILYALECAARVYEINPLEIYDFNVLSEKVVSEYMRAGDSPYKSTALYNMLEKEKGKVTGYAASRLLNLNKRDIVAAFTEMLDENNLNPAHILATVLPQEFAAAVFINAIKPYVK